MCDSLFTTPNGIISLPQEHVREVTDIDEELFLLYTLRGSPPENVGLGGVDSRSDIISISLDIAEASKPLKGRRAGSDRLTLYQNVRPS